MKLAVNENTIFQCDFIEFVKACSKAGFEYIEASYLKLKEITRFVSVTSLKEVLKQNKIQVVTINAFEDIFLMPENSLKILEAEARLFCELCIAVECSAVVAPSGRWYGIYGQLPNKDGITKLYRERLLFVKNIFSEYGIEVMFEPIAYPEFVVGTSSWTNEILAGEDFKDISIVPDIHNLYYNGEGSSQILNFNNPIKVFHVDDTIAGEKDSLHVAKSRSFPGEGVTDATKWVDEFYKNNTDCIFSLELFDDFIYEMNPYEAATLCMEKLVSFSNAMKANALK